MSDARTPSARERDTAALVQAAIELFAERGPAATSLREVAARAGVNYGLLHQYIGNKDDLVRLVARRVSEAAAARYAAAGTLHETVEHALIAENEPSLYLRMLARTLLDGHDPADLLGRSPALAELIRQLTEYAPEDLDADEAAVRVAALMSMVIGWRLFGPFLQHAVGLGEVPSAEVGRRVLGRSAQVLGSDAPQGRASP